MKFLTTLWCIISLNCTPHKLNCYELTLSFNGVTSKQKLCTDKPLNESFNFKKLS